MFALIFTLCTLAGCDSYVIAQDDEWTTPEPCEVILVKESDFYAEMREQGFGNDLKYQARFGIRVYPSQITDYDYTCEKLNEDDIP